MKESKTHVKMIFPIKLIDGAIYQFNTCLLSKLRKDSIIKQQKGCVKSIKRSKVCDPTDI